MSKPFLPATDRSRRFFIKSGLKACLVGALMSYYQTVFSAEPAHQAASGLGKKYFDLTIARTPVNITGKNRLATTINGTLPGPTLRWKEGQEVVIRVKNSLDEETSIHWHGIILPYDMDGAPVISFDGISPGETFTYRFKVRQAGTYWYHSHSGMQEQTGLYGAIVIEPAIPEPVKSDRDYVVMLSDWTDEDPMSVFAKLKKESAYYNINQPTVADFIRDVAKEGLSSAVSERHMWNRMRMNRSDLADISAMTYTYLINGQTAACNWHALFKPGEKVRLRFINSSAQSFFDVRIPGLKMAVVAADGQPVEPVEIDEFRIGLAETYDVIVSPAAQAYTIFAQAMDRTGFARATLATKVGLAAAVPAMDKPQLLTMADMMGGMRHEHDDTKHSVISHQNTAEKEPALAARHYDMEGHAGMMHHSMSHDEHNRAAGEMKSAQPLVRVNHANTEFGANVDMRVDNPRTNLDDPGVGLRNNGRRVLTYADLRSAGIAVDARKPSREIELHLTGNMERYMWSFDGVEYADAKSIAFNHGERVRVILVNDTMMAHPIHLHGMWSDLENESGEFQVRKHTVVVQPAQRLTFRVTADALGRWPWHCHLFYHMHAGMFRDVVVF